MGRLVAPRGWAGVSARDGSQRLQNSLEGVVESRSVTLRRTRLSLIDYHRVRFARQALPDAKQISLAA